MSRPAYLIFNPTAGQGNPDQDLEQILALLTPEFEITVQKTTPGINPHDLACQALKQGAEIVFVAGGDGTISAVAGALRGSEVILGIIPCGTANALASALGIGGTIEAGCQTILAGHTHIIDTATCNGHPMVLLAGIGFEADMIGEVDPQIKKQFGILAYLLAGFQQLQEFEQFEATIETEAETSTIMAAAITVANIAPATSVLAQGPPETIADDGLLDITVVSPKDQASAINASYHLLEKALQNEPATREDIDYQRTKKVTITTNPPQKVVMDGELIGKTPIEVECVPQSLTILIPEQKLSNLHDQSQAKPILTSSPSIAKIWRPGLLGILLLLILLAVFFGFGFAPLFSLLVGLGFWGL